MDDTSESSILQHSEKAILQHPSEENELENAHEQLKNMVKERDLLIQEIHHRVKNNLQIIISLIDLQLHIQNDRDPQSLLEDLKNRIQLMAILHDHLYHQSCIQQVDLGSYIKSIIDNLSKTYNSSLNNILVQISTQDMIVPFQKAILYGLLVNELVSNSIKHAFPMGRAGSIHVELSSEDEHVYLVISDDGIGIPSSVDIKNVSSFGLQLIDMITTQLKGTLDIDITKGTKISVTIPPEG